MPGVLRLGSSRTNRSNTVSRSASGMPGPRSATSSDGPAFAAQDPDRDVAAAGIFERVVEQVGERLRQQVAVAADHDARRGVERQRKALLLGHRLVELDRGAGDLGEIERLAARRAAFRPPPRRC